MDAVLLQVVVLDRRNAKTFGSLFDLGRVNLNFSVSLIALQTLFKHFDGAIAGFIKQLNKLDRLSFSSLDLLNFLFRLLSIFALFDRFLKDHAKWHVVDLGHFGVIELAKQASCENLLEVEFLANISDINDTIAFEVLCAVSDGRHIGRVVVKAAI